MRTGSLFLVLLLATACGSEVIEGGSGGSTASGPSSSSSGASSSSGGSSSASGGAGGATGGAGGSGGIVCNPNDVLCNTIPPSCPVGEVPSVVDQCWGACVPILSCASEPNCDACQLGFCAEYVAFTVEYRCVLPTLMCSALACSCLAPYFCTSPFDACSETPTMGDVSCGCPTC